MWRPIDIQYWIQTNKYIFPLIDFKQMIKSNKTTISAEFFIIAINFIAFSSKKFNFPLQMFTRKPWLYGMVKEWLFMNIQQTRLWSRQWVCYNSDKFNLIWSLSFIIFTSVISNIFSPFKLFFKAIIWSQRFY